MLSLHGEELHGPGEAFVRAAAGEAEPDTVLATVLFTDIVDSTAKAVELGDAQWADLVGRHHALVRRQLDGTGASNSTPKATDSLQPSTGPSGLSAAPVPSQIQ